MTKNIIDFRSDTVTKSSKGMLDAIYSASVGDDVYKEDPTVIKLEEVIAHKTGKEAAIFAPSGTQTNLLALMSHCGRGDEYIVGQSYHTYFWEGGGAAVLGSIQPQPIECQEDGSLDLTKVESAIKPIDDHYARTKLLSLENTTGGKVLSLDYMQQAESLCAKHNLNMHLDGARVFNAAVALNVDVQEITKFFDSISICLSKGLGAPIGSVLCGSKKLIVNARRWRKVLGGGMRQVGYLAAAGIYAIENNVKRLHEDHQNANYMAQILEGIEGVTSVTKPETNIFYLCIAERYNELRQYLAKNGIIFPDGGYSSEKVRLVTHLDISRDDIDFTIDLIRKFNL